MKKFKNKLLNIVGAVAPTLGTALGGPFGGLAVNMLKKAFGTSEEEEVLAIIEKDPAQLVRLKEIESLFKAKMKELGIEEKSLYFEDKKSARNLAIEKGIFFQALLSTVFVVGYFLLIYLFFEDPGKLDGASDWTKGQLGVLIGVMTACIPQIMSFWLGSSEGSRRKTDLMKPKNYDDDDEGAR